MTREVISMTGRGARGESFADVARRLGEIAGIDVDPDDTDAEVLDKLVDGASGMAAEMVDIGCIRPSATDDYAKRVFADIVINGLDDDDVPFINYQFSLVAGVYRDFIRLYSTKLGNVLVAKWDVAPSVEPETLYGSTYHISMRADGGVVPPGDYGVTALVTLNRDEIVRIGSPITTTYTDASATGIKPGKIVRPETTRQRWLAPAMPIPAILEMTIGASGDFADYPAAKTVIEQSGAGEFSTTGAIKRSTYPATHRCIPERPLIVRWIDPGMSEQITPFVHGGLDMTPLIVHHGMILHLPYADQTIYMDTGGSTAPVVDVNMTGALIGLGKFEQRGSGYCVHMDNNNGTTVPFIRQITTHIGQVTLSKTVSSTVPVVGLGVQRDQYLLFDGTRIIRGANASNGPFIGGHNSPGDDIAGTIHLRNVTSDIAGTAQLLAMDYSQAGTEKHVVIIENSDCPRVTFTNSYGGSGGWRRRMPLGSITVVSGSLDP